MRARIIVISSCSDNGLSNGPRSASGRDKNRNASVAVVCSACEIIERYNRRFRWYFKYARDIGTDNGTAAGREAPYRE